MKTIKNFTKSSVILKTDLMNIRYRMAGIFIFMLAIIAVVPVSGYSQGSPVSAEQFEQINANAVTDNSGGSIVIWQDKKNGKFEIYAQRMNPNGQKLWNAKGVLICDLDSSLNPTIVSDGLGGAIIAWESYQGSSTSDIYVQRVNQNGEVQWDTNGVPVAAVVFDQNTISMISDGLGGAILTWEDYRSNNGFADIYTQRVDPVGDMLWTANGVSVCNQAGEQGSPKIVSDGLGGAFISWHDNRAGNFDIYTQLINFAGAPVWTTNGAATCTMATDQLKPDLCSDGAGGIIVTWYDFRSTTDYNIYAQRQGAGGGIVWAVDGVVMNNNVAYAQIDPQIISDDMGGAILSWTDYRTGITSDIYSQRVNSTGEVQWTATGVIICTSEGDQVQSQLVSDGNSGAYITWQDHRLEGNADIYAQRIASNAAINWAATGFPICTEGSDQLNPVIVSNGDEGAIVVWQDFRNGDFDIYSAGFNLSGLIAEIPSVPVLLSPENGAIDQSLAVTFDWSDAVNAETYQLQISSDSSFGKPILDVSGILLSNYEVDSTILNNSTEYYWRVRATNVTGSSEYAEMFSFTTAAAPIVMPSTPELVSPSNGLTGLSLTPTLEWNAAQNADSYELQISKDTTFEAPLLEEIDIISTDYAVQSGVLSNGSWFFWRVRSVNINGSSEYSEVFSFRTISSVPMIPVLLTPAHGSINVPSSTSFDWEDVNGAEAYKVQVAGDSLFTNIIIDEDSLTKSIYMNESSPLVKSTTYYWRVIASNKGGEGEYSSVFMFTVDAPLPPAPLLISPVDGAKEVPIRATLDWNDFTIINLDSIYEVEVALDDQFNEMIISKTGVSTSEYTVETALASLTPHFWRVRLHTDNGTSEWSEVWSFTTADVMTGIISTGGEIPKTFELGQNYPNPFNPTTKIRFGIPHTASGIQNAQVTIYNILGQSVASIFNGQLTAGTYEVLFDASSLTSGTYFYELRTDNFRSVKRMALIK